MCPLSGRLVAYLPDLGSSGLLIAVELKAGQADLWRSPLKAAEGRTYRLCRNYTEHQVCNWTVLGEDPNALCVSCRLTRVIPDLIPDGNRQAWYRLEVAKRRLIFTLLQLRLPIVDREADPENGLAFEFKADASDRSGRPHRSLRWAHHDQHRRGRRCGAGAAPCVAARAVSNARRPFPARERTLLLGSPDRDRRPAGEFSSRVRRRARLTTVRRLQYLLCCRSAGGLAASVHQCLRQRTSPRGLGRDLGALSPHGRHAGDRGGVWYFAASGAE